MPSLRKLRRQARADRRRLPPRAQREHATAVARRLVTSGWFLRSRTIGVYLAADGEVDLSPFVRRARKCGKRIFLPALRTDLDQRLWFIEHRPGDRLGKNRFGIEEPDPHRRPPTPPWALDIVLMPLVAFDTKGNRLGMGGGFYDRTFAYLRRRPLHTKPALVGIAHECQHVRKIPIRSWDIPMNGLVTEHRRIRFPS